MKYLVLALLLLLVPVQSHAYFATKSLNLVKASNQYAFINKGSSTNLYATSDFTWESWVKFSTLPPAAGAWDLYAQSWTAGGNLSFLLQLSNTAGIYGMRARATSDGSTQVNQNIANVTVSTGTWYHLAFVYTASAGKIEAFLNGVSQGSQTGFPTSIFNGSDPVTVGNEANDGNGRFDGLFSNQVFWNSTRTATQIVADSCAQPTGSAAAWGFDNVYTDASGNGNTLTSAGTPTFASDVPTPTGCTAAATFNPWQFWDF